MMRSTRNVFGFLLLSAAAAAQQYVISTYAGGAPPLLTPAAGVDVSIGAPSGIVTDAAGNIYFTSLNCVFKLDQNGTVTRIAGTSRIGYSGDGGAATNAQLYSPFGLTVDGAGNLFIADFNRIRKVSPSGIITTVAGDGTCCSSSDGGPATSAALSYLTAVAVDGAGNLFIVETGNNRIRKVTPDGIIATVAGDGTNGFSGDGGPATGAQLSVPYGVTVDGQGNLFVADSNNFRIRKISPDGIITTVAGDGTNGFSGDGGPATSAQLSGPTSLAVDAAGNLFLRDSNRIRKISRGGIITTVAGNATIGFSGDGGPATSAQVWGPSGVAVGSAGNLFIADSFNQRIRKVSPTGIITTVAGNGNYHGYSGDGGPATSAQLGAPWGTAVDSAGNVFVADSGNNRIRKVTPSGIITTVAGNGTRGAAGDGGRAISAQLNGPIGLAADSAGELFIADSGNNRIRKVSHTGIITTVAGNGTGGASGDGGPATSAALYAASVAVDRAGNLFIAGGRVRRVSPSGMITTVAGTAAECDEESCPPLGDGGPVTSARLSATSVAVDSAGNLFIADSFNQRIRKVSTSGIITTVAGGGALVGSSGDGGPATSAALSPTAVALDGAGNLFIADSGNRRIRKVSTSGIIATVAGNGTQGFSGDGGPATNPQLDGAARVAVDSVGNVYVADTGNHVVRVLRPTNQSVFVFAAVDAASQRPDSISPDKIVVIYGAGLGPSQLIQNQPRNGVLGTELAGTKVVFNGISAPVLYTWAAQVAAVAPYALTGATAQVTVTYQGEVSAAFTVPVAASAPSIFTLNQTGAGQAAAINAVDGTVNTAANPVKVGGYISLYATGEGQTTPASLDGRIGGSTPPRPVLPVSVTVGGIPATVQYAGGAPGQVAGLMQVNVQIPSGVQPGGYVPVVLQVGDRTSSPAVWIAVSEN